MTFWEAFRSACVVTAIGAFVFWLIAKFDWLAVAILILIIILLITAMIYSVTNDENEGPDML